MVETFERSGVRFQFPGTWSAEADDAADGWTVAVQSPETAFLLVSLRGDADDPGELADLTLAALRGDYQELDAEAVVDSLAGRPAVGYNVDFMTVDTPIACRVRCLETESGVLLVMSQVSEFDRDKNEPVLRAVCASLRIDEDS